MQLPAAVKRAQLNSIREKAALLVTLWASVNDWAHNLLHPIFSLTKLICHQ